MNFPSSQHKGIGPPLQCQETRPTLSGNGVGLNTADFDRFGRFSVPPIRAALAGYLLGTETRAIWGMYATPLVYMPQENWAKKCFYRVFLFWGKRRISFRFPSFCEKRSIDRMRK